MGIRSLWIDADGTLLDIMHEAMPLALHQAFESLHLDWEPKIGKGFTEIGEVLWSAVERGLMPYRIVRILRCELLCALHHLPVSPALLEETFRRYLHETGIPSAGALEALKTLGKEYDIEVITNGELENQKERLEKAGLLAWTNGVFASSDIGASKPDLRFFQTVLEKVRSQKGMEDLQPDEVVVIGDSAANDVSGGMRLGAGVWWFNDQKPSAEFTAYPLWKGSGADWKKVTDAFAKKRTISSRRRGLMSTKN